MRWLKSDTHIVLDGGHGRPRPSTAATDDGSGGRQPVQRTARHRDEWPGWVRLILKLLLLLLVLGALGAGGVWYLRSAKGVLLMARLRQAVIEASAVSGFFVREIDISGNQRTSREEIETALHATADSPILAIDLEAARQRIEDIAWVKSARLERLLPNTIRVVITERTPVALWQSNGQFLLIDETGAPLGNKGLPDDLADGGGLLQVVGEGAPDEIASLRTMLDSEPDLARRVKAAVWVGDRRWDLQFDLIPDGIVVKLPEENPQGRYHELAELERRDKVLERRLSVIDLRLDDRTVLRQLPPPEPAEKSAPAGAHH